MKKFPKPWYRPTRGVWYVTLDGQQINLGSDEDQAFEQYKKLLARPQPEPIRKDAPASRLDSLASVIDAFLEWVQRRRSAATYQWYQYRLQRFLLKYPALKADQVRPFHVEEWVNGYDFSANSRRNYMRTVKRCMRWARGQGYLRRNPIAGLELPAGESREVSITQADIELLLANIKDATFSS